MSFTRERDKENAKRWAKIDPFNKLEGIRLLNELADSVLSPAQKRIRRKLREAN